MSNKRPLPRLAKNICEFRIRNGLSQAKLGKKVGCTQQVIFTYESGLRVPPPATLAQLADVFRTSVDTLIGKKKMQKRSVENPRLWHKLKLVEKLPPNAQKNVVALIGDLAAAHKISV